MWLVYNGFMRPIGYFILSVGIVALVLMYQLEWFGAHDENRGLDDYVTLQKIDPLYAFPGMDLNAFMESVDALEASRDMLARHFDVASSTKTYRVVYPIEYLRLQGELERVRRELIREPTKDLAWQHRELLLATIDARILYIERYLTQLSLVEPESYYGEIIRFHNGYANADYFKRVLETYLEVAHTQREEEVRRYECLVSGEEGCLRVPSEIRETHDARIVGDVEGPVNENRKKIAAYREVAVTDPSVIIALSQSQCVPVEDGPVYYHLAWLDNEEYEVSILRPDVLNTLYYYDLREGPQAAWSYAKEYIARGGPRFAYQPLANHYVCPDLATDLSVVLAVAASSTNVSLEEPELAYRLKTVYFPELIMSIVHSNTLIPEYDHFGTETTFDEFLYTRNVPKVLLGGFNPSVVPIDIRFVEHPMRELPEFMVRDEMTTSDADMEKQREVEQAMRDEAHSSFR